MKPLAVLRPEPGASATLRRAALLGLDAFKIPLFSVEARPWTLPEPAGFDALLLTSANAVRCAGDQLRNVAELPVHAVGAATADTARAAGLKVASVGAGGIDELLARLPPKLRLLHLCGEHRRIPLATKQQISAVPIYRSTEVPCPPGLERLEGAVALIHSPRAGRRLAELVASRSSVVVAAISAAAAEACGAGWAAVQHAERACDEALLSLGARLCKESAPE